MQCLCAGRVCLLAGMAFLAQDKVCACVRKVALRCPEANSLGDPEC